MSASLALIAGLTAAMYTVAPTGWYRLCSDDPAQCRPVTGTMPDLGEVDAVNRLINDRMRPQAEANGADVWKVGGLKGDCEDYALAKRDLLLRYGVGSAYARMAVGMTAAGDSHAVLIVTTTAGLYVLDNLQQRVVPLARSTMQITAIQSPFDPRLWIKDAR
ncbi:transglutaminase-like cysteine peptidase [Pleomorphomonas koreensis]|uniref:transglutaminase-like cysteine peptidase n=1 Tax=Pleomorphomonas koreensis TaxID=257440 RepID=UPI00069E28A9|nr:transglutaminase-like cysteine peptidase [Pleomorphomonas koreensis]